MKFKTRDQIKFHGNSKALGKITVNLATIRRIVENFIVCLSIAESDENGYNLFGDVPDEIQSEHKKTKKKRLSDLTEVTVSASKADDSEKCEKEKVAPKRKPNQKDQNKNGSSNKNDKAAMRALDENSDDENSDSELFEIEESETPLVPLYHLRDEGSVKWVLLSDLCYLLKVKSKDTLLKQVTSKY